MAETDPRKVRPFGQTANRRDNDSEEDPLLELARIVSEDSGFPGTRPDRAKQHRDEPIDRNALSADLEAELLQELESSFASRSPAGQSAARRPAPLATPEPMPADDADDLLRSIEAQLGEFERRAQSAPSARQNGTERNPPPVIEPPAPVAHRVESHPENFAPDDFEDTEIVSELEQARQPRRAEAPAQEWSDEPVAPAVPPRERAPGIRPTAWRDRPENSPESRTASRASRNPVEPERLAPAEERQRPPPERQAIRSPLRRRDTSPLRDGLRELPARGGPAAAVAGWSEISAEDEAATQAGAPQNGREAAPADYRRELRTTIGFDEAPELGRAINRDAIEADRADEVEPDLSDPTLGTRWADGAEDGYNDPVDNEPRVSPAGPIGDGRVLGRGAARGRGSRKGMMAAAGVLGVLVLGGAVLALMRPGEEAPSGPPPVIAAPSGEVKIEAPQEPQQAQGETVGEAVYNRVAGDAPAAEEQVVDGAEEPQELSRIVLPPPAETDESLDANAGAGSGADAPGGESVAASNAAEEVVVGPRRVRTYVVRPDGTISAAGEAPAAPPPAAPAQQVAAVATPIEPVPVTTRSINAAGETSQGGAAPEPAPPPPAALSEVSEAPAAIGQPAEAAEAQAALEPAPAGAAEAGEGAARPDSPPPAQLAAVEPAAPEPAAPPATSQPRATDGAPVDLLSNAPAQEQPASAPAAGEGYVVQVSSQRSRADAQSSLAAVQQRYQSVLGGLPADIQEADLGAKGVYYRVRVGSWPTRAEAIEVCEALKGAGGTCFVTR